MAKRNRTRSRAKSSATVRDTPALKVGQDHQAMMEAFARGGRVNAGRLGMACESTMGSSEGTIQTPKLPHQVMPDRMQSWEYRLGKVAEEIRMVGLNIYPHAPVAAIAMRSLVNEVHDVRRDMLAISAK